METCVVKRVEVLGVPVDECDLELALKAIEQFLMDGEKHQIVLLDRKVLFRARRNPEYRRCLREASLILPAYTGVIRAARFLSVGTLHRFTSFELIIRILSITEKWNRSLYLLGARKADLEKAERNLRDSFPGIMMVGRFSGYFSRQMEQNILVAIKKASPSFMLVGDGVPDKNLWILRNLRNFNPGVFLWEGNCLNVFSGRKQQPSKWLIQHGLESLSGLTKKPWLAFRFFPFLYFWLLVMAHKIFRR